MINDLVLRSASMNHWEYLVYSFKVLRLTLNDQPKWQKNIESMVRKAAKRLYILRVYYQLIFLLAIPYQLFQLKIPVLKCCRLVRLSREPDAIPNRIIKNCAYELAESVYKIFNISVSSGLIPTMWKDIFITQSLSLNMPLVRSHLSYSLSFKNIGGFCCEVDDRRYQTYKLTIWQFARNVFLPNRYDQ